MRRPHIVSGRLTGTERVAGYLPDWMGSVRFRLTALYSLVLFGLAAMVVSGIYLALAARLDDQPMARRERVPIIQQQPGGGAVVVEREVQVETLRSFEQRVNRDALRALRTYSFGALGLLFLSSLVVGWVVAGRVLAPIDRITAVARDIQATDLSRRIGLRGPPDELKDLADTFDGMLTRLDDAFEQQRRFIQEASHELRNPLAVIRTNVEVALDDPHPSVEELRATAVIVNRSAARMSQLVDDLLAYARRGALERDLGPVDLTAVVSETADEFAVSAAARRLSLSTDVAAEVAVRGDRVALRQALANLLANAVRLAPEGSEIRVAAGEDDRWAWVAVDDGGPGIAPEHREVVFDRFWRGDGKRAREEGRSGLGLTIVRGIASAHGGAVQVQPNARRGSTFTLWLPRIGDGTAGDADTDDVAIPAPAPVPAPASPRSAAAASGPPRVAELPGTAPPGARDEPRPGSPTGTS